MTNQKGAEHLRARLLDKRGQSLIEVLIALAASVAVVSAIVVTVITSLSNAEFTKNQNLATQYSREGIEIVRQTAKNSWSTFINYKSVNYCLDKSNILISRSGLNCGKNISNFFDRQIIINQNSPTDCANSIKISSLVLWSDSKCQTGNVLCHQIEIDSCLSDINSVKAP